MKRRPNPHSPTPPPVRTPHAVSSLEAARSARKISSTIEEPPDIRGGARPPASCAKKAKKAKIGASIDFQLDKADLGTRKITCPLLVLWGTQSWFNMGWDFLAIWREWADDVRGRGIDSGHFLAEEVPDETYEELRAFFSE